jgi:AcrR family transcriptional regulator
LLAATTDVLAGGAPTTTAIVERAGVGRNTFYEHFDSVDDAVSEVVRDATERTRVALRSAVAEVRTPRERLRALALAWLTELSRSPVLGLAVRGAQGSDDDEAGSLIRSLETDLRAALGWAREAGVVGLADDPVRVAALVGAFVATGAQVSAKAGTDGPDADQTRDVKNAADTLADLVVRAFR